MRCPAGASVLRPPGSGAGGGGEPLAIVEELARHHLDAVRRVRPEGPYHLGGWSMGGMVAWEMAWQLHQAQRR